MSCFLLGYQTLITWLDGDIHSLNSLKEQSFDVPRHRRLTQVGLKFKKKMQQLTEERSWLVLHLRGETTERD